MKHNLLYKLYHTYIDWSIYLCYNYSMYYDGNKLLSLKDLNNETPELYLVTTNRTGGKTTWFSRLLVKRFKEQRKKFALVYRFNYELDEVADKFFKDIRGLFFKGDEMESERRANGIFHELFLNGESCGYALTLNSADQIKKYSHLFSDVDSMLFDEFQSETNHYCADEITKFISVHTSVARGQGKQIRHVPVYMIGNTVSLLNPYYIELGISERLKSDTKFLRGDGFVLEQGFIESASAAQKESPFNRAFKNNKYVAYAAQNVYLNDNSAFLARPSGPSKYLCTLKYEGANYGIREYANLGFLYVDSTHDETCKTKIVVTTEDHQVNYVMLKKHDLFIAGLRKYFEYGAFRFKNLKCKNALLKAISY